LILFVIKFSQDGNDLFSAGLQNLPILDHLLNYVMSLLQIEYDIQLANLIEVLVQSLDKKMNKTEVLVLVLITPPLPPNRVL
jgi:hypothetical protein